MSRTSLVASLSAFALLALSGRSEAQVGNVRPLTDMAHTVSLPNLITIPNPPIPGSAVSVEGPRVLPVGVPLPVPQEARRPIQLPGAPSLPGLDHTVGHYIDFDGDAPSPGSLPGLPGSGAGDLPAISLPEIATVPNGIPSLALPPSAGVGDGPPSLPELVLPPPLVSVTGLLDADTGI